MRTIVALLLIAISLNAQERVLLHIGRDGKQEAIPLAKGQRAQDVISRIENEKASMVNPNNPTGPKDTLRYYPGYANGENELISNFGFTHQDVAFQWFEPSSGGKIKEVWWRNYSLQGKSKKATIRAWYVDPHVKSLPVNVQTKHLGYYKDPTDSDGFVTPYKPATGDQYFYGNGLGDSTTWRFDPLGMEAANWISGGVQLILDSGKWQGIKFDDWGDSLFFDAEQLFGFTLQNDSKPSPFGMEDDTRMEILSWPNTNPAPYHSYKFYEIGRTSPSDKGWHLRGDYEWGMYVVIEYNYGPHIKITLPGLVGTTLKSSARAITVNVRSDYPGIDPSFGITSVYIKSKKGFLSSYDSALALQNGSLYTGYTLAVIPGDTVYWQFVVTAINGNRTVFGPRSYVVFRKNQNSLLLYNNAQISLDAAKLRYSPSLPVDAWSTLNDGMAELDDLLEKYNQIVVVDGPYPALNIYPNLKKWFQKGTAAAKKGLYFTSQDFGCYVTNTCQDTTFVAGSLEYDYLGISMLGPQDQGQSNRPYKIVPQINPITNKLVKYNSDSSASLWHYPTFESGFSGYPDAIIPRHDVKVLFKDGTGTKIHGIVNEGPTFISVFLAFDTGSLQFRGDTSLHSVDYKIITDPKYRSINDLPYLSIPKSFFCMDCEVDPDNINDEKELSPFAFSLNQNFPNPFNPTTEISYQIPLRSHVTLKVFDLLGREVAIVVNEQKDAGKNTVTFNGQSLSSGMYFYEMRAGSFVSVKKMLLMK